METKKCLLIESCFSCVARSGVIWQAIGSNKCNIHCDVLNAELAVRRGKNFPDECPATNFVSWKITTLHDSGLDNIGHEWS